MKLYMFRTVPLSIIRSLFTVHSAIVYLIQVCRQLSSRTRMELQFHCKIKTVHLSQCMFIFQLCRNFAPSFCQWSVQYMVSRSGPVWDLLGAAYGVDPLEYSLMISDV